MVGREVLLRVDKAPPQPADPLLEVEDLHVLDDRGIEKVRGVSFEVRGGEIVGIAGIDGNGQTELIDAITGLRPAQTGGRSSDGEDVTGETPRPPRGRARAHPGGPAAARARARVHARREHRAARLRTAARLALRLALPGRLIERARALISEFDVRGGGPRRRPAGSRAATSRRSSSPARSSATPRC